MRIDSMDATTVSTAKPDVQPKEIQANTNDKPNLPNTKSLSQLSELDKKELPISEKVVLDAIERVNKAISGENRRFEFSVHEKTKGIMIKVVNTDTNQVVREIPPEKILDMVANMMEMAGLIVDERR